MHLLWQGECLLRASSSLCKYLVPLLNEASTESVAQEQVQSQLPFAVWRLTAELLSRQMLSSLELRNKLLERGCPNDIAQQAVDRAKNEALVDDHEVYAALVRLALRKVWSENKLKQEARKRGLQFEENKSLDFAQQIQAARSLLHSWCPDIESQICQDSSLWKKFAARLARRGFSSEVVMQAMQNGE